ncbi:MAG: S26 family signal peptidase [Prevotellaceae bacterium]|jgi:signal peptidase I|nr:S26 family signal peptidase [Prevotellaceae bacterium]
MKNIPLKNWIKCAVYSLLYIAFIAWVGNFWWLLLLPFIVDIFITKFIPWTFWKKSKNPTVRKIGEWVDAILFALVAVYFINLFLFQNYQIPSSSLEKTLLVGDFLLVSKVAYGPRTPNTPLSFPLAQHTLPIINTKSYIENPQWDYRRLKGFGNVQLNDIVVFNFPAGDTVATNMQQVDYYTLVEQYGRAAVWNNKEQFGDIVWRPVDRRENYVKRCVGLPGDTLQIIDTQLYLNGKVQENPPLLQHNYFVETTGVWLEQDYLEQLGISGDDRLIVQNSELLDKLGFERNTTGRHLPVYHFPLTKEMLAQLEKNPTVKSITIEPEVFGGKSFPFEYSWTRDNYGPIYIPKRGATIAITIENLPLYERVIRNFERNKLEVKNGAIYINDQKAENSTFKMDYFWLMGDNRHNSADSRSWGFVPEDHVVGRPVFVWLSLNKDKGWFDGKIRWKRFFKNAKR